MEDNFDDFNKIFLEKNYVHAILNEDKVNEIKLQNKGISHENFSGSTLSRETIEELDRDKKLLEDYKKDLAEKEIIPPLIKLIYSLPSFGKMSCLVILNIHALLYYESIGASLLYLSFFVSLARAFEIILKPVIAHISDHLESRYGRRKPFMLFGCFFYAIFLIILFTPPSMRAGASYISIWFGTFYVLFFIADTITNVPYLALGPELSSNTKEREKLYIFFYLFQYIGVLFASAAPVILNKMYSECDCSFCYNNPAITRIEECLKQCKVFCNLKHNRNSLFYMAVFIGTFFVFSILLLCWKIKERNSSFNKEPVHFLPSLYRLVKNRPFIKLIVPWIIDILITTTFSTMLPFFLNFVINPQKYCINKGIDLGSDECSVNAWLGYSISTFFIFCIVFMFMWHYLVKIYGKKRCWEVYSLISILTFSFFLMCGEGSFITLIFSSICCAIPAGGSYLNDVFISDIIEYDEFFTGKRNEGLYTVFATFVPKVVSIFAQAIPLAVMSCKYIKIIFI